jgi:hypothetical protein
MDKFAEIYKNFMRGKTFKPTYYYYNKIDILYNTWTLHGNTEYQFLVVLIIKNFFSFFLIERRKENIIRRKRKKKKKKKKYYYWKRD